MNPSLRTKIETIATIIQRRYSEEICWESEELLLKSPEKIMMLHPSTSVVIRVLSEWTRYWETKMEERRFAPMLPRMYPMMLATMMLDAVRSTFKFFLRHTSRAIVIVRMVSRSSSSTPIAMQERATIACRIAKI